MTNQQHAIHVLAYRNAQQRVPVALYDALQGMANKNYSRRDAARVLGVAPATLCRWLKERIDPDNTIRWPSQRDCRASQAHYARLKLRTTPRRGRRKLQRVVVNIIRFYFSARAVVAGISRVSFTCPFCDRGSTADLSVLLGAGVRCPCGAQIATNETINQQDQGYARRVNHD